MHRRDWRRIAAGLLAVVVLFPAYPAAARSPAQPPVPPAHLSPYWPATIQRWEPLILEEAQRRGLDPDLIAAVIWKESHGLAYRRGPAGAVGLMMVMPKEAGFAWRPPAEQLMIPEVNLFWGARALSIVIRQSRGDLFGALAAYNGGWEQVHLRVTQRYARDVLLEYVRSVAVRNGLPSGGHWVATVAALDSPDVLTVLGPQRTLSRYSRRPIMAAIPDASTDGLPTAVAFWPVDGLDMDARVGVWILLDGRVVRPTEEESEGASSGGPSAGEAGADISSLARMPMW